MIFVHNSWDLFNWHGILWYGRFLYKGSFGMVSFVMGAFGMVSFVLTPFSQSYLREFISIFFIHKENIVFGVLKLSTGNRYPIGSSFVHQPE